MLSLFTHSDTSDPAVLVAGEQGKQKPSDSWVRSGTAGSTGGTERSKGA